MACKSHLSWLRDDGIKREEQLHCSCDALSQRQSLSSPSTFEGRNCEVSSGLFHLGILSLYQSWESLSLAYWRVLDLGNYSSFGMCPCWRGNSTWCLFKHSMWFFNPWLIGFLQIFEQVLSELEPLCLAEQDFISKFFKLQQHQNMSASMVWLPFVWTVFIVCNIT